MSVSSVENQSIYLKDLKTSTYKTELGKDDFLKLLLTQMQYQDPLSPMENNEYISQMAQLSSLEQMTNMTQSFSKTQAIAMMGKTVTAYSADGLGQIYEITGTVDKVNLSGGNVYLTVNEMQFLIDDVSEVSVSNATAD